MKIALTIVHNKTPQENEAQINALLSIVEQVEDVHDKIDDQGTVVGSFSTFHYKLTGLQLPHEAYFYQVVPFGVTPPPNFYKLDSHNVIYGNGDEDKTGDHPRFFNWSLKRGTDYGAEVSIYLESVKKLDLESLSVYLNSLVDPTDKHEFVDDPSVKIASLKLLKDVGQLDESKTKTQAISDLKARNEQRGNKNG